MDVHKCNKCPYKSQLSFAILYHVRRHHSNPGTDPFSCEKTLELYSCPHCNFGSDLRNILKQHVIGLHQYEENREFPAYTLNIYNCRKCKFQTFASLVMLKHVTKGCDKTVKWYKCDQCQYVAKWTKSLQSHKLYKHTSPENVKWWECGQCGRKFKENQSLRRHTQAKHEIKWFHCDQCSYRADQIGNLIRHVKRIHGDSGLKVIGALGKLRKRCRIIK